MSTYQAGMVLMIGIDPAATTRRLWLFNRHIERCMGLANTPTRLTVAGLYQIIDFVDPRSTNGAPGQDPYFVPQVSYFTGDVDAHDLAHDGDGAIVFANTLFSCVATVSSTFSFKPVWTPPFITKLAAEDRCHLNGIAMRDGALAYATMVSRSDSPDGWRNQRRSGGVIFDTEQNEMVAAGLSMPHSPRWFDDRLWILNSGTGELGTIDLASGAFEPVAYCPGYLRGLAFIDRYAIVGSSEPREKRTFGDLPLQDRLERDGVEARCGLFVIDTDSGDVVHWLRFTGVIKELFDIAAIPAARQPKMVGFRSNEVKRVISIEGTLRGPAR